MDILSIIHLAVDLGAKVLKAPPNFEEMREAIWDITCQHQGQLLKQMSLTPVEISQEILRPGSEAQKKWNAFITLALIFNLSMQQYYEMANRISKEAKDYEAALEAMEQMLALIAKAMKNWEQGMLDDEQQRMTDLLRLYQEQHDAFSKQLDNIYSLHERRAQISEQLVEKATLIQNIAFERIEKVENSVNQSSQKQSEAFDKLSDNLSKLLEENKSKLAETNNQLASSDLTGQQHEELSEKAKGYSANVEKLQEAEKLVQQQKEAIVENNLVRQQIMEKAHEQHEQAKSSGDAQAQYKAAEAVMLGAEMLVVNDRNIREDNQKCAEQLSKLLENVPFDDKTTDITANLADIKRESEPTDEHNKALEHREGELGDAFDEFNKLYQESHDIHQELRAAERDLNKLHLDIVHLNRDMNAYTRNHRNIPPSPSPPPTYNNPSL